MEQGMIAGLIGPNAAGKTAFFNSITGVYTITSGQLSFDGHSLVGLRPFEITALGIARTFQNIRLFANMTALENVLVGEHVRLHSGLIGQVLRTPATMREESEPRTKPLDLLEFVGLRRSNGPPTAQNLPYRPHRPLQLSPALP